MTAEGAYPSLIHLVSSLLFYNPVSFKWDFMKVSRSLQISVMTLFLLSRQMMTFFKHEIDPQNSISYYASIKQVDMCPSSVSVLVKGKIWCP